MGTTAKSRVEKLLAERNTGGGHNKWSPPDRKIKNFIDEVLQHNQSADAASRIGRRQLIVWLLSEFKVKVGRQAIVNYLATRSTELGLE